MKLPFKNLWLLAALTFVIISCSGDDESDKTSVKYIVTSESDMITSLQYRNANGNMIEAIGDAPGIEWTRSINVDIPFDARLEVTVVNTESEAMAYDLAVYVDGELVDYLPAEAPANGTDSSILEYDLN